MLRTASTHTARFGAAVALIAGSALAQTVQPEAVDPTDTPDFSVLNDATPDVPLRTKPAISSVTAPPATIGSRSEKPDGSVSGSAGHRLPIEWEAKVGVDFGLAAPAATARPDTLLPGQAAQDRGTGWANVAVPAAPIGFDKATIDARVDPARDQGKLSTTLSRSVPVGGGLSLTLQNGYAVTQTLANPNGVPATPNAAATAPGATHVFSGDGAVRLELPSATAFSAGAKMSSTDDKLLRTLSAEQKLFGTPLSITGSISERPTGDADKSIKAGFKRTW